MTGRPVSIPVSRWSLGRLRIGSDCRWPATRTPHAPPLSIKLDHRERFRRLLIFVYTCDATPAFARATVTFCLPDGQLTIGLDEHNPHAPTCAVALIDNHTGQLNLRREAAYIYGFQAGLDRLYRWRTQWTHGRK
ncbi:hypothetical protein [Streptomyces sp. NBC_00212]|uniref:hypothetical protein n=1 Tax=Streptomyces sp. NBC_00212 TaxID=2975684 RepID=UPI003250244F